MVKIQRRYRAKSPHVRRLKRSAKPVCRKTNRLRTPSDACDPTITVTVTEDRSAGACQKCTHGMIPRPRRMPTLAIIEKIMAAA